MLTIVVAAYNEERHIAATLSKIVAATHNANITDWEIIVCNDGSMDKTSLIVKKLCKENPRIHLKDFKNNQGVGAVFNSVLQDATSDKITCLPGDNSISLMSITKLFLASKKHHFVTSTISNQKIRPNFRRFISKLYTSIWRTVFNLKNINYINGSCIYPVSEAKKAGIISRRFAFSAELTSKLIIAGVPNFEISLQIESASRISSVFSWHTVIDIIYALVACLGYYCNCLKGKRKIFQKRVFEKN